MILLIIKVIVMSLAVIGIMTTIGIILYPWTELVVSSLMSLYYSKRYSTKVTHSNYVHFNNSPLYHRDTLKYGEEYAKENTKRILRILHLNSIIGQLVTVLSVLFLVCWINHGNRLLSYFQIIVANWIIFQMLVVFLMIC